MQFVGGKAECVLHQVVRLADELHVAILDPVMHHLYVMPGAVFSHPIATGRAVLNFGGDSLEDGLHMRPGGGIPTGHDGRPPPRAFLATGNAGANVKEALARKVFRAAASVRPMRVAAVDDDVTLFQVRQQIFNHMVDGVAGLDHQHDPPRSFERRRKLCH